MYNYYRQGWVVGRVAKLWKRVFGTKPIVLSVPYQPTITPRDNKETLSFLIAGSGKTRPCRRSAPSGRRTILVVAPRPSANLGVMPFGPAPPSVRGTRPEEWFKLGPARVRLKGSAGCRRTTSRSSICATDGSRSEIRGMLIVAPSPWPCYSLRSHANHPSQRADVLPGRGLHAPGDQGDRAPGDPVRLHLDGKFDRVRGDPLMALLSNLYVLCEKASQTLALLRAIGRIAAGQPRRADEHLLALPGVTKIVVSCLVVFIPIFFAGVVFTASFVKSQGPTWTSVPTSAGSSSEG